MNRVLKILRYFFISLLAVLMLLIGLSYIFQGKVAGIAIKELNRSTGTSISIAKVKFSLISNFPRVTLDFRDIKVESTLPAGSIIDSLAYMPNLLEAASVSASFNPLQLLRKNYLLEGLEVSDGYIFIVTNGPGHNNLNLFNKSDKHDSTGVKINLRNIKISNTDFIIISGPGRFYLGSHINSMTGRVSTDEGTTDISYRTKANIKRIVSRDKIIISNMVIPGLQGELGLVPGLITFRRDKLELGNQSLLVEGNINTDEKRLKLEISGEDIELTDVLQTLSESLSENVRKHIIGGSISPELILSGPYKPSGKILIEGSIYGNGIIINPGDKLSPVDIDAFKSSISVNLSSPGQNSEFNITDFRGSYAGSTYSGSFKINKPESPNVDLILSGPIDVKKLLEQNDFKNISDGRGIIHTSLRLSGSTGHTKELGIKDIFKLKKYINLNLDNVDLMFADSIPGFKAINGNIMIAENIWLDGLSFIFEDQSIVLNCMAGKISDIIAGNKNLLEINAGIWANRFDINSLKRIDFPGRAKNNTINLSNHPIIAGLTINADSLFIGDFICSQFTANATLQNNLLRISSFNAIALDGTISGNAGITKSESGSYITRGWYDLDKININKAFSSFNNFGQEGLKAENIEGVLSGSVSLGMKTDQFLKPDIKSVEARGYYSIMNGELKNYEPARKLSRFVEISELENIRFEEVKNNLVIQDSRITIPSMDINSSAFNISLSGVQEFNGPYEYHLKILLSDILGRKAKKSKSYISEFGPIEDDGLGRTTLYLKLKGDREGSVVSYDMARLSENIKTDISREKQDLKAILNEEFGWYKKDSISNSAEKKTRKFRITWEEAGSIETLDPPEKESRTGLFRRLKKNLEKQEKRDTTKRGFEHL